MKKDPDLSRDYDRIIREQEQTGIVQGIPKEETTSNVDKGQVYYSPHHVVIWKDREMTKVRIAYDGSAKSSKEELSLNNCLEPGDNYIPHIFVMLASFRNNPVRLTAGIEKAFLMMSIKEEETCFASFGLTTQVETYLKSCNFDSTPFCFGLRPSIHGATIAHHLRLYKQNEPEMAMFLEKSLYVDDLLFRAVADEKALEIYHISKRIMQKGGFNLKMEL